MSARLALVQPLHNAGRSRLRLALLDAVAWSIACVAAALFVSDLRTVALSTSLFPAVIATVALHLTLGVLRGLYRGRFRTGTFAEVRLLLAVTVAAGLIVAIPSFLVPLGLVRGLAFMAVPRTTLVVAIPAAFLLMAVVRSAVREMRLRRRRPVAGAIPVLILGAGEVGGLLVRRMMTEGGSPYDPVGFLDDDIRLARLRIDSVPVLGTRADLESVAARTGARVLVVAVARADATLLRDVSDAAGKAGMAVQVVPPIEEMLTESPRLRDLRDVSIDDLVGRQPVDVSCEMAAERIRGRRVLVTGAGGSIGSELCRQIARLEPAEIIMLDRDETALQQVQVAISGHGLLDTRDVVLADIRDGAQLASIFAERRPEVVFHAAALKHLPMLEQYPAEAWKTNVIGTLNVLDAAEQVGVSTFVNISTDKAANPASVLGASKRLAERLTSDFAERTGEPYLSVRFGNVLGSRGSLIPLFTSLLEAGQPLTVTHPEATRYFMSIPEACLLVTQAAAIGSPGEVLILDMGDPVRILDVAERMIAMSGRNTEIVFTGLRPGEKLHEELIGAGEREDRRVNPKISHAKVPPLAPQRLDPLEFLDSMQLLREASVS